MKILRLESLQLKRKKCPARGVGTRQLQIIVCDFDKFCFFVRIVAVFALFGRENLFREIRRSSFVEQRASTSSGNFKTGWLVETEPNFACLLITLFLRFYCMYPFQNWKESLPGERKLTERRKEKRILELMQVFYQIMENN